MGTGRQGDGKRNLPQEMGHPRETNLPHDMGLPRPELAGRETGRGIYHSRWELAGRETGRGILPQEMGHLRWELAGRETGRGIYRMQEMGHSRETNLPHDMGLPRREWDFQGRNWQVGRKHVPQQVGTGR